LQNSHFLAVGYGLNEGSPLANSVIDFSEINESAFVRSLMWLDKHSRHWTLTQPRLLHVVCSRGIGFQPIVFGTVFALSSDARLAAYLPVEFASRIWHVAKPVMLDVPVHYETGSQ
jgi:hypothetical protein